MENLIRIYRLLFARPVFVRWNKMLCRLGLSGLGILNFESEKASGERAFLARLASRNGLGVVLDVGANVGNYSQSVMALGRTSRLVAFEPHPGNYRTLCNRLKGPAIQTVEAAVGSIDGETRLFDYPGVEGTSHASLYRAVIEDLHRQPPVQYTTRQIALRSFLATEGLHRVDLLKIDVEGHELAVLDGLGEALTDGSIKVIHFEFNEMNVFSRTFFRDFMERLAAYDLYRMLPQDLLPLDRYSPLFCEIFAYQNIVAILKTDRRA